LRLLEAAPMDTSAVGGVDVGQSHRVALHHTQAGEIRQL
jgi:hypothetical protein